MNPVREEHAAAVPAQAPLRIMICAGEISGDMYGAALMRELRRQFPNRTLTFFGLGGDRMREEGAEVTQVMSITNYAIPETMRLFAEQGIATYDVIAFDLVVKKAHEMGIIDENQTKLVMEWLNTPWTWAAMHGVVATAREN